MKPVAKYIKACSPNPNQHWWSIIAGNGEVLAHSEIYTSRSKMKRTANRIAEQLKVQVKEVGE